MRVRSEQPQATAASKPVQKQMRSGSPASVLALQRKAGNRAVAALLQRKVPERNFPGGGKVDEPSDDEFVFWNFDVGSATLKAGHTAEIGRIVARLRPVLQADKDAQIDIEGQASLTGTSAANDTLATRRATAIRDVLVKAGIDPARIRQTSTGELKSQPEETQRGLALSRAVRVVLVRPTFAPSLTPAAGGCDCEIPLDIDGGKVTLKPELTFIALRAGEEALMDPGMRVTAMPGVKPPGCARGGALVFVQNVLPFREIVFVDGSRITLRTSLWHLDKRDPYPSIRMPTGPRKSDPPLLIANDAPSERIPKDEVRFIKTVEVRDHYRMFFVVRRPDGDTTLQVAEWAWVGLATNNRPGEPDGQLVLDKTVSRIIPVFGKGRHVSEPPVKSPHVSALRYVAETGGLSHAVAVPAAALFNLILAKTLGKKAG